MPHVNWDDAEKKESVSDGTYLCRIDQVIEKKSKSGKEMFAVILFIETEGDFYGRKLFHNIVFSESTMWMVKLFYEAAIGKTLSGEQECKSDDLLGKFVKVHVKGKNDYGPILNGFDPVEENFYPDIPF